MALLLYRSTKCWDDVNFLPQLWLTFNFVVFILPSSLMSFALLPYDNTSIETIFITTKFICKYFLNYFYILFAGIKPIPFICGGN